MPLDAKYITPTILKLVESGRNQLKPVETSWIWFLWYPPGQTHAVE